MARFFAHTPRTKPPVDSSDDNFPLADDPSGNRAESRSGRVVETSPEAEQQDSPASVCSLVALFQPCLSRARPRNKMRITAAIRISIRQWYRSLLTVRGPAPAAKAAIPNNTPPRATRLVINAMRHRVLEPRKSAIAPHNKQSPHRASTIAAGMMTGSWNGPTRHLHVECCQRKKAPR